MARSRRSATRSVGPQSPPKARQPALQQSPPHAWRSARSTSDDTDNQLAGAPKVTPKLQVVEEESGVGHGSGEDSDSISLRRSDLSDGSEDQEDDLDVELMVENLPALFQDALRIISFADAQRSQVTLANLELQDLGVARRIKHYHRRFETNLLAYRHDDGFIPVDFIHNKLVPDRTIVQSRGIKAIFYVANLAILLSDSIWYRDEAKLELLANRFPGGDHVDGGLVKTTSELALDKDIAQIATELKTQYVLSILDGNHALQTTSAANLLQQAFFDEDGQPLGFESCSDGLRSVIAKYYNKRVTELSKLLPKKNQGPANSARLVAKYPLEEFSKLLVKWVQSRKEIIEGIVDELGGAETLMEELRGFTDPPEQLKAGTPKTNLLRTAIPSATVNDTSTPNPISSVKMTKRVQQLKRLMAQRKVQASDEGSEESSDHESVSEHANKQEIPGSPILGDAEIGGLTELVDTGEKSGGSPMPLSTQRSIAPSQKTAMILEVAKRQAVQSNKENINTGDNNRRFVDRQKGAERVEWDESAGGNTNRPSHDLFAFGDDDIEDDFEVDTRARKRARIERDVPSARQRQVSRFTDEDEQQAQVDIQLRSEDLQHNNGSSIPPSTQPSHSRSPLQIRSHRNAPAPGSSAPPGRRHRSPHIQQSEPSSTPPAQEVNRVNREAKVNVGRFRAAASATTGFGHQPQIRRAWSAMEIERLMDMVAIHGTAWAMILQEDDKHPDGPQLQTRGQVALKDKARNIKMDYLKACQPLPEGFASVSIKRSDMDKLDELSIPHQGGLGGRGARAAA